MKIGTLLALAARNIRRNTRRTVLTLAGLAVGISAINLFQGYQTDTLQALRASAVHGEMIGHLVVVKRGALEGRQIDPEAYTFDGAELAMLQTALRTVPEVAFVAPRLLVDGLVTNGRASIVFFGLGIDPNDYRRFQERFTYGGKGEVLSPERPVGGMMAERMAAILDVVPGDNVTLFATTLAGRMNALDMDVLGVFDTGSAATNDKFLIVPMPLARRLYQTDGAHEIAVAFRGDADVARATDAVRAALRETDLDLVVHNWRSMSAFYRGVEQLYGMIFGFIFLIVLAVALMSVLNTMTMAVMERVREIGVLRALGMHRRNVRALFAAEGLLLGLLGGAIAVILSLAVGALVNHAGITYTPPGLSGAVTLAIALDGFAMIANALAVAILCGLAALLPAHRAVRLEVVAALRHV